MTITTRIRPTTSTRRTRTPRTTSLGTTLAFRAVSVVGAPRGSRRAYVTTGAGTRYAIRIDPTEHLWRVDRIPSFGPTEAAVPGYFTSPELAAYVLDRRLALPHGRDTFTLRDVRQATLDFQAGHTIPSAIFDAGSCALRAAL